MSDLTDQHQWEKLIKWIKTHGLKVALIVIVGGGSGVSWQLWQSAQFASKAKDSLMLEQIVSLIEQEDLTASVQLLEQLKLSNQTDYAFAASFKVAKLAYAKEQRQQAVDLLTWVLQQSDDPLLVQLAADRAARVLLDMQQYDQVIQLIQEQIGRVTNPSALGTMNMVLGDAHIGKKQYSIAISHYDIAKQNLPEQSPLRELIEIKTELARSF